MIIKAGDRQPVTFTVNHDLTGTTTRLIVRHGTQDGVFEELHHEVTGPNTVVYVTDGTWAVGRHYLELEITQGGETRTAPTDTTYVIRVIPDLDD